MTSWWKEVLQKFSYVTLTAVFNSRGDVKASTVFERFCFSEILNHDNEREFDFVFRLIVAIFRREHHILGMIIPEKFVLVKNSIDFTKTSCVVIHIKKTFLDVETPRGTCCNFPNQTNDSQSVLFRTFTTERAQERTTRDVIENVPFSHFFAMRSLQVAGKVHRRCSRHT